MKAKSAEVSFHLHATEDGDKVGRALKELLGIEDLKMEALYGHNGNIILDNRASLGQPEAEALLDRVLKGLPSTDRALLLTELGRHIDEKGTLFVRVDKQELVRGRVAMGDSDSIRISFRLVEKGEKAEELVRACLS
jgi:RNA binding exosome subunit